MFCGFTGPSRASAEAFERAVEAVVGATTRLLGELVTPTPLKEREEEAVARARRAQRFAA
jgi:hypothetical protein